jgi:peptidyl-prolyl cis-trans isomerase C
VHGRTLCNSSIQRSILLAMKTTSGLWQRWATEPIVHFILIGLLLCAAKAGMDLAIDSRRIAVTPQRVAQLAKRHEMQFGVPPDAPTLQALVDSDVRDEILYREGLALGIDKGDEMVRRRVIQKMEFISQDLNPHLEPTESALLAFHSAHLSRYEEPSRVSFTHVYFSPDKDGPVKARSRAAQRLEGLEDDEKRAPQLGDPFPDLFDYSGHDPTQVRRLFGNTPISAALMSEVTGRWFGPVQSAYGWHLVRIASRTPARSPAFDEVRGRVRDDLLADAQSRANAEALKRLAGQYTIVRSGAGG